MSFFRLLKISIIPTLIASSCATYFVAILLEIASIIAETNQNGTNELFYVILYFTFLAFIFGSIFNIFIFTIAIFTATPLYIYMHIENKTNLLYRIAISIMFIIIMLIFFYFISAEIIGTSIFIYGLFMSPLCTKIFHRKFTARLSKLESRSTQPNESHSS